jgi:hypothetical protein
MANGQIIYKLFTETSHYEDRRNSGKGSISLRIGSGDKPEEYTSFYRSTEEHNSTLKMVISEDGYKDIEKYREKYTTGTDITIETHTDIHLNLAFSVMLVRCILEEGFKGFHEFKKTFTDLKDYVLLHSQGFGIREEPECSLAMLFQAVKDNRTKYAHPETMKVLIDLLNKVDNAINKYSFSLGWNRVRDIPGFADDGMFGEEIKQLEGSYLECQKLITGASKHLLSLPVSDDKLKHRFKWVDGIFLDFSEGKTQPLGWKEWVRFDRRTSPGGKGYVFTLVTYTHVNSRWYYIISVDPESEVFLKGFEAHMEYHEGLQLVRQANIQQNSQDCWYSGHNNTIVWAPCHTGTSLVPSLVQEIVLNRYDPLWRDAVDKVYVKRLETEDESESDFHGIYPRIADILNSLAERETGDLDGKTPWAVYIGVDSSSTTMLPDEDVDLATKLALYLGTHRLRANDSKYPQIARLKVWYDKYCWQQIPGLYVAVSDTVLMAIDYSGNRLEDNKQFKELQDQFFALQKQLIWADKLPVAIKHKKRHGAICEFIERHSVE